MKKTQPIDWDKVKIHDFESSCFVKFSEYLHDWYCLDNDFIAAFDEMLENEIKNRGNHHPVYWDDVEGWKPLFIQTDARYYLNNA